MFVCSISFSNLFTKNFYILIIFLFVLSTITILPNKTFAQQSYVSSIMVEGNKRIPSNTIINISNIIEGNSYTPSQINSALQRLKTTSYFKDVNIYLNDGILNIDVIENPTINSISFEGNYNLKDENLIELISSKERQSLSISKVEKDTEKLASAYSISGRISAQVIPKIIKLVEKYKSEEHKLICIDIACPKSHTIKRNLIKKCVKAAKVSKPVYLIEKV